jgi:hypothetical protein
MNVPPRGLSPSCPWNLLLETLAACTLSIEYMAVVFGVSTVKRVVWGWVDSGGKYNKARAMAIYIVLHICSVRFARVCLARVKCSQIPSSQIFRTTRPAISPRFISSNTVSSSSSCRTA